MSPRLSARDASILTLIAETPTISQEQLEKLLALATSEDVKLAAQVLSEQAWASDKYRQDVKDFARAIYDSVQARRRGRDHIEIAPVPA
jgi:hypothetical protein